MNPNGMSPPQRPTPAEADEIVELQREGMTFSEAIYTVYGSDANEYSFESEWIIRTRY